MSVLPTLALRPMPLAVRDEIAAWYPSSERALVERRLGDLVIAAPEPRRSELCIAIVQRTAGSLRLLESAIVAVLERRTDVI
ncbi:hypothetical protein [Solimonas marina]|uniref:Uncharacterized protein n=1 Tax=Solimonas marina TaxID=2714601 RepID=A0A969W9D8_9GAMM|nr:hypothetical protein [Solimonas marina]NKF21940.1 hypothetical protein [Solimonas marina]